jgi:hypothetical protein
MKTIIVLTATLFLTGCYTPDPAAETTDKQAFADCVSHTVAQMDDGRSDPMSIAYGVEPVCAPQYEALTELEVGAMITENAQDYMRNFMSSHELELITLAVLTHRQKTRTH